jgi:hypothetical protein
MKVYGTRQRKARLKGIVASHHEAVALVAQPGDVAVVKRGSLRSVVMRCPDGCGDVITLNLDPRTDKAWRLYKSKKGITLFPSVWRDTGCQSHFVLWNDAISWVDFFDVEEETVTQEQRQLEDRVWGVLKSDAFTDFVQVADALEEIPWAILDACRRLVKAKRAVPGTGPMKSSFKKLPPSVKSES